MYKRQAQDVYTVDSQSVDPGFIVYREEAEGINIEFSDRLHGRFAAEDVKSGGKTIVKAGDLISKEVAGLISKDSSISDVTIRSVLTCSNLRGVTVKSYGCLLYTSDAADERSSVDLGGRRIIKKKNNKYKKKQ